MPAPPFPVPSPIDHQPHEADPHSTRRAPQVREKTRRRAPSHAQSRPRAEPQLHRERVRRAASRAPGRTDRCQRSSPPQEKKTFSRLKYRNVPLRGRARSGTSKTESLSQPARARRPLRDISGRRTGRGHRPRAPPDGTRVGDNGTGVPGAAPRTTTQSSTTSTSTGAGGRGRRRDPVVANGCKAFRTPP